MINTRKFKIFAVISAIALLLGALLVVAVSAEESPSIIAYNVEYGEK